MTANQGDDPSPIPHVDPLPDAGFRQSGPPAPGFDHLDVDTLPVEDERPSVASRIVSVVLAFVVGVVYGAVGTVAHPLSISIGPIVIPWGLVLSLIGVFALFVGLRLVLGERLAVLAAAVGVVGIVALFSLESTGGSVLIQQGVAGLVWVLGPALIAALVISFPSRSGRGRRTPGAPRTSPLSEPADRLSAPAQKEFPTP